MSSLTSLPIHFPSDDVRRVRRVSAAALHELEIPRPPGGWNSLERFASSYQRSTTFLVMDAASPGSSFGLFGSHRSTIPDFCDDNASQAVEDDEETGLLTSAGTPHGVSRRPSHLHGHDIHDHGDLSTLLSPYDPKHGDEIYDSILRPSRRPSLI